MTAAPWPWRRGPDGIRLFIRLTPRARRDGFTGIRATAQNGQDPGGSELCASVTAVPEAGKANEALLKLLARALKCPVRDLGIVAGATDRHKQVHIAGEPAALEETLAGLVAGLEKNGVKA